VIGGRVTAYGQIFLFGAGLWIRGDLGAMFRLELPGCFCDYRL